MHNKHETIIKSLQLKRIDLIHHKLFFLRLNYKHINYIYIYINYIYINYKHTKINDCIFQTKKKRISSLFQK